MNNIACSDCGLTMTESKALSELDALKKDAERYRTLRRGQHWSVIDGIGDTLRAEGLDAAIDAVMLKTPNVQDNQPPHDAG